MIQRRQVFGALSILAAALLLVVAMVTRLRMLPYVAYVLVAAGFWMISRRGE